MKIVNCNVKCFCGAQGGSMLEIHVATMRRVVMEIIGKRGREWGGTWVVLGSRKSCDHMCMCSPLSLSLSLPPLFCGCGPIHLSSYFSLHNLYIYPQLRLRWSNRAFNYTCSLLRVLLLPTLPLQSCFSKPKGVYIHLKTSDLLFENMYENSCG